MLTSSASAYYWLHEGNILQATDMAARGLIVCYCLTLLCGLLKNGLEKCVKIILVVLGVINLIVDKGVYNICHSSFNRDTVGIILGSNLSEASEFSGMYLTPQVIVFVAGVLICIIMIYKFRRAINAIGQKLEYALLTILVGLLIFVKMIGLTSTNQFESSRWDSVFLCKLKLFCSYERPVNLSQYYYIPEIETKGEQPANIVIIIGESISRSHCSLYGYEMETQPFTGEIKDSLILFQNVTAAGSHTISSFRRMWFNHDSPGDNWYEECTLFSYLAAAGYHQEWISNQASSGVADNAIGCYASLTDTVKWVGTKGLGIQKQDYDGLLISELAKAVQESKYQKNCYFIHMMGCHESFQKRCPDEYVTFTPDDYDVVKYFDEQRLRLSQYDNALRYGDYVIRSLMDIVVDKEAIVVFIPDHALDLYETDASYIGHARASDEESVKYGTAIPLMIFASREYKAKFGSQYESLIKKSEDTFNAENFTPFMMDLCNIEGCENYPFY